MSFAKIYACVRNRHHVLAQAALLAGLMFAGCSRERSGPPPGQVPEVAVTTVSTESVVLTTELPGRTSAFRVAEIRPQVSGILQKRLFTEGSDVEAGQVLYQIDPAPFEAALANARAALARAEAQLPAIRAKARRFEQLLTAEAISQQNYDDVASALKQAEADVAYWQAAVETARINLGYTRITAPISGRIGKSNVTEGALVTAFQPLALATIQQLDPIYVDVPQSTQELLRLKRRLQEGRIHSQGREQNEVGLLLEDGTPYRLKGALQFRDVTVEPTTGSVILRVVFPNPHDDLLPGMFVRAVIQEGVNHQAILIPQQAVSRDPKGNPVALIVDGEDKVQQRTLTLDRAIGDQWLVSSGLTPGDRVIVEGTQKVRPGSPVKAVPLGGASPPSPPQEDSSRPAAAQTN